MHFHFTQEEFESRQYKCLEFGDETEIAKRMGKHSSYIQQMCSPNDERESFLYNAARFIVAEMDVDFQRGCALLRLLISMVERHQPNDKPRCAEKETGKLLTEWSEFLTSAINGKPTEIQIAELEDVIHQATELKKAKEAEMKKAIAVDNGFGK